MSRFLIVNADDYGRTASVSAGIREAHLHGLVTTTTAMMNMPTVEGDLRRAMDDCPRLGLGVHLNITAGRPILPAALVPTLVDGDGRFHHVKQLPSVLGLIHPEQLRAEWRAQIDRFLATGATLDHLDSHHHTSYLAEGAYGLLLELAAEHAVPIRKPTADDVAVGEFVGGLLPDGARDVAEYTARLDRARRVPRPDRLIASFYDVGATLDNLLGRLGALPEGVTEMMCHPGLVDEELRAGSSYNYQREEELRLLTSGEAARAVRDNDIQLGTFRNFLEPAAAR